MVCRVRASRVCERCVCVGLWTCESWPLAWPLAWPLEGGAASSRVGASSTSSVHAGRCDAWTRGLRLASCSLLALAPARARRSGVTVAQQRPPRRPPMGHLCPIPYPIPYRTAIFDLSYSLRAPALSPLSAIRPYLSAIVMNRRIEPSIFLISQAFPFSFRSVVAVVVECCLLESLEISGSFLVGTVRLRFIYRTVNNRDSIAYLPSHFGPERGITSLASWLSSG
jgi:hypothetical protein